MQTVLLLVSLTIASHWLPGIHSSAASNDSSTDGHSREGDSHSQPFVSCNPPHGVLAVPAVNPTGRHCHTFTHLSCEARDTEIHGRLSLQFNTTSLSSKSQFFSSVELTRPEHSPCQFDRNKGHNCTRLVLYIPACQHELNESYFEICAQRRGRHGQETECFHRTFEVIYQNQSAPAIEVGVNCGAPVLPANSTTVSGPTDGRRRRGSEVTFRCNEGLFPSNEIIIVCTSEGRWSPDPQRVECTEEPVSCPCESPTETISEMTLSLSCNGEGSFQRRVECVTNGSHTIDLDCTTSAQANSAGSRGTKKFPPAAFGIIGVMTCVIVILAGNVIALAIVSIKLCRKPPRRHTERSDLSNSDPDTVLDVRPELKKIPSKPEELAPLSLTLQHVEDLDDFKD